MEVFPYSWNTYEENGCLGIRIFGLNAKNENVFILVNDFNPYVYLELPALPSGIEWTSSKVEAVSRKIDEMCQKGKPSSRSFQKKKKLYYAKKDISETGEYTDKLYSFLKCSFSCHTDLKNFSYKMKKPIHVGGIGTIQLKVHESEANPILQFMCSKNIKPAGWFKFSGKRITNPDDMLSSCDHEYETSCRNFIPIDKDTVAAPLIMGFDIEVNSSNPNITPQHGVPGDKIFQISCVFCRNGDKEESYRKCILSLSKNKKGELIDLIPEKVGEEVEIYLYETEGDLLCGFTDLVNETNPQILCGYNIFSFDIPYMYNRSKLTATTSTFDQLSFIKGNHAKETEINWSSSAFKNQHFIYLDAPGRLWVDMLPIIQRDYKLENYKLKTVSDLFLGTSKDPLSVKGIFKCYRMFTPESLSIVAKYCVKDSELVVKLFEKLQIWIGLCEMSNTCNTPIFTLFTQGQQIKIFSQVYKKCLGDNIVIDKDSFIVNESDHFTGAYVFTPVPGLYDMVVSFDFSSLYPSTIIAYNIDYSTLVLDEKIPDDKCHIFDWSDHCGCEHDLSVRKTKPKNIVCGHNRFRFLKEPPGVIPTLLKNLLDARKKTNNEMKRLKTLLPEMKEEEKEFTNRLITVLDKRQLSYKVSANSVSANTPIPCLKNGKFMYLTIEEISNGLWISDDEKNEVSKPKDDLYVWTEKGYTKIKFVIRHPERTPLKTVLTHTGCVNVTDEHSLLDDKAKEVRIIDLDIGDKLLHSTLPLPVDTPKSPLFLAISKEKIEEFDLKNDEKYEVAFVWGLFFAEGTAGTWGVLENAKSSWIIYNQDYDLLLRAKKILEKYEKLNFKITEQYDSSGVRHLTPVNNEEGAIVKLCDKYRNMFYDRRGSKRMPDDIFNSDFYTRQSFMMGYYAGDGCRLLKVGVIINNKGEIGTAGLCYLAKSLGYIVSVNYNSVRDIYRLQCCTSFRNKKTTSIKEITISNRPPEIKKLRPDIIRNNTNIFFNEEGKVNYRGISINCERIPRQKLLDCLDKAIENMKYRKSNILEYYTDTKKIKYEKWCCKKTSTIGVRYLDIKDYVQICDCENDKLTSSYHDHIPQKKEENINYIYDIETENHHFAAGVGDIIVHNSMYGGMGVKKGYLPFLPGAMCTTARGRQSIEKASKFLIENYGAKLIYGDTDSCYISFPQYQTAEHARDLDGFCRQIEDETSSLFPKPMKFAYEEAIYWRYLILSKKRYMALKCDLDGKVKDKIEKRGVLLSRRDNSAYSRDFYSKIIMKAFYKESFDNVNHLMSDELNRLSCNSVECKDLSISKSVGDIKDYKIRPLPDDDKKLEKRLNELHIFDKTIKFDMVRKIFKDFIEKDEDYDAYAYTSGLEYQVVQEYVSKALPSQVQLAEKMRRRGSFVSAGERLAYVVIQSDSIKDKLFDKIEDVDYYRENVYSMKIDYLYYTRLMINPIDEVIEAVYSHKDLFKKMYKYRENYFKVVRQLTEIFSPKIILID